MYAIYSDNNVVHRGDTFDKDYKIISGTLRMEYNMAGTLTFTVSSNNRAHRNGRIKKLVSVIKVYRIENNNNILIWKGRVIDDSKDLYNRVTYTCEGWLGLLNDIFIRRVPKYTDPSTRESIDFNGNGELNENVTWDTAKAYNAKPSIMFKGLVSAYNSGKAATSGNTFYLNPAFTNYATEGGEGICFNFPAIDGYTSILDYLENNVINANGDGGHLWVGDTVIHYDINVDQKVNVAKQEIRFGSNLLDLTYGLQASNFCTRLYVKGTTTQSTDQKVIYTYVYSNNLVAEYGWIDKYFDFGYVYDETDLKRLARNKFNTLTKYAVTISLSSVNLSAFGTDSDRIRVGDYVKIMSEPNKVQKAVICTGVELDMVNVEKATYDFGVNADSLSALQIRTAEQLMSSNTSYVQWMKNETMETEV